MRKGIDYFPLDTTLDTKFELLEAEFGLKGFAIIVKLFQKIYGIEGYYCEVNDEVALLFGKVNGLSDNAVFEIISAAVRRGIFDRGLYEKYSILTSEGIQKRYFEACKRREKIEVIKEYLLGNAYQNFKNVYISEKNVYISEKNANNSAQSKESKESKESKGEDARASYGAFENVFLTDEELNTVKNECGSYWGHYIERLSDSMYKSGKAYAKDGKPYHAQMIIRFYREDKVKGKLPEAIKTNHQSYDLEKVKRQAAPIYERKKK